MKKLIFVLFFLLTGAAIFAQIPSEKYNALLKKAEKLYYSKNYKGAAQTYSQAFKLNHQKASPDERYNAACAWAMANEEDSAYFYINKITESGFSNYKEISTEHAFKALQKEKRWKTLLVSIQQNAKNAEAKLNKPLISELDSIHYDDQKYRAKLDNVEFVFGADSKKSEKLWQQIKQTDSIDLIKVKTILDRDGWLGADVVGEDGNMTLFLVIQHSDQQTQEHYLPMMREAVKNGNAKPSALALLEDRVALQQGKKQIYGSQIITNPKTGKDTLAPVEDFANVDKRRATVGLQPLQEYVANWGIVLNKKKPVKNLATTLFTNTDFATAMEIHDSIVGPVNVGPDYGKEKEFNIDRGYEEKNSAWFKFTIDFDTVLTFDIVPENRYQDYDFFIFKCADVKNCANKNWSASLRPDRWCFSENFDKNGSTGLSEYAPDDYLGGGPGMGYVSGLKIKAGETCYLMVNYPYDNKPLGFTIYFYNYWPNKPKLLALKHPAKKAAPAGKPVVLENVLFASDKTTLLKESTAALDKLVELLQKNKTMNIEIRGHTDNTGDEKTNQQLSEARAKAIVDYLISKKIEKERLSYKGFGSTQPVAPNDSEEGKKMNRRVEFVVKK